MRSLSTSSRARGVRVRRGWCSLASSSHHGTSIATIASAVPPAERDGAASSRGLGDTIAIRLLVPPGIVGIILLLVLGKSSLHVARPLLCHFRVKAILSAHASGAC